MQVPMRLAACNLSPYRSHFRDQAGLDVSAIFFCIRRLVAVLAGAAMAASCAQAPVRDRDDAEKPTFVSLNPCLDALLVELADPDQILALSHYSRDPQSSSIEPGVAAKFTFTGGTAEEVLALQPDIVLASTFMARPTRAAFERLGIQVETFDAPQSPEASYDQIERLAGMTLQQSRAERLVERIEEALDASARMSEERGQIDTLLWQSGEIVAGEGALVTRVLANAGFVRKAEGRTYVQGEKVSLEQLVASPPELALVAGGSRGQRHPVLTKLENTRVETLDPSLFYCGGPSLIALAKRLEEIREGLAE
ncbi:ABC transporter substrate-binding protein [Erythrobacter sp. THAF29]|uniref:ABC transporter substrate-binding protein n=1 Tax=Erythrobacter sp. THAF29 TaxID=2587851 RepID=UPI0012A8C2A9|nr:ABC transporter substrate-binding protein [Erythrobacter sp. THAF29]QFT78232.1 corrinoid ABC transporter substrate-binding protein [Erythrobacter sp. THAF29]